MTKYYNSSHIDITGSSMFENILTPSDQLKKECRKLTEHVTTTLIKRPSGGLSRLATKNNVIFNTNDQNIQLVIIGGSRTTTCIYNQETRELGEESTSPTPTLDDREILKSHIQKIYKGASTLIVNFAFPVKPTIRDGKLEGVLVRGTKQHSLKNLVNKEIGSFVEEVLGEDVNAIIINDITALLYGFQEREVFLAGIVGTGVNFGLTQDEYSINLEAGNYSDFSPSKSTLFIDKESNNRGQQLWEKAISGKYLKDHFNFWAQEYGVPKRLTNSTQLDTLTEPKARELGNKIIQASAQKTAVTMAAIAEATGFNDFVLEGSVMWKAYGYFDQVTKTLYDLGHSETSCIESNRPFHNLIEFVKYSK